MARPGWEPESETLFCREQTAMAISKQELQSLIERNTDPSRCVLSVYLDVDQSRASNLNRHYVANLKDMLRACEQRLGNGRRTEFRSGAERVLGHVSEYSARARSLVIFSGDSDFFWQRELCVPFESTVRWDERPYVRPLVEAMDEYERYCVALVDRERARLFTAYLGEIEEHLDILSPEKRKYFKGTSKDTTMSQPNLQRKEEEHALWHLKEVAGALDKLAERQKFDRLILAGPHELANELRGILPRRLQALVVRDMPLPFDSSEQNVLRATMRVEEEVERDVEKELVERLITAGSKDSQAVLGLEPTLDALRLGRILKLVYTHGFATEGGRCTKCNSLFAGTASLCAYCGGTIRPVADIVARLADRVFDSGGQAEEVRGPAAERLTTAGKVGAFLRF